MCGVNLVHGGGRGGGHWCLKGMRGDITVKGERRDIIIKGMGMGHHCLNGERGTQLIEGGWEWDITL